MRNERCFTLRFSLVLALLTGLVNEVLAEPTQAYGIDRNDENRLDVSPDRFANISICDIAMLIGLALTVLDMVLKRRRHTN